MKKKVFLSSTFLDLRVHRREVWSLLKDFDIDIIGMEAFGARTSKPLETCIKEATEADIYIGIISMRYGSIDSESGKSFTQLEYEAALASNREIFIYLFDRHTGLIHPDLIDYDNIDQLNQFICALEKNHTIDHFTSPNDLCDRINDKLSTLLPVKQKKRFRPEYVKSVLTTVYADEKKWTIVVGYMSTKPIELYIVKSTDFNFPESVSLGWIQKRIDSETTKVVYDYNYLDGYGYLVTCRGLSRGINKSTDKAGKLITSLLVTDTPIENIIAIVPEIELSDIVDKKMMYDGIISALTERNLDDEPYFEFDI